MADGDEEEEDVEAEFESGVRRRNPSLDDQIPVTDEEYASGRIYRFAHEKSWIPTVLDSRITDATVENEDRQGFRFLVPIQVVTTKREEEREAIAAAHKVAADDPGRLRSLVSYFTDRLGRVLRLKSGVPVITRPRFGPDIDLEWQKQFSEKRAQWWDNNKSKKPKPKRIPAGEEEKLRRETDDDLKSVIEEYLTLERRWAVTPMALRAFPQSPRRPFFMIPKQSLLDVAYSFELDYKIVHPDELVEYQYCGCENDEELIRFIRTDPGDGSINPPFPMVKRDGNYYIPRKFEDERGMSLRVHRDCAKLVQSAEEVYLWELRTKEFTHYYDNHLFDNYLGEKSDEGVFAWIAQEVAEKRMPKHTAQAMARKLRKYYENFLEREYDRWLPCESYDYRHEFFDRMSFYGDDWASKADRIWDVIQLQVFVISYPTVIGIEPYLDIDWSTFKAYIAPIENRRDIVRLYNHWKMTKNMHNARASIDIDNAAIKNARSNDMGSMWNAALAGNDWRFKLLKDAAAADPARALTLLGPIWIRRQLWQELDHDGALMTKFLQKWKSWVDGLGILRELSSMSGLGLLPRWDELNEKYLTKVRSYRSEYHWMQNDEYTTRDPIDAWKNQAGIITFSLLDEVNLRLEGPYRFVDKVRLNYDNCTNFKAFIVLMWYFQPLEPIKESVEHALDEDERNHIFDTLETVVKHTKGLPCAVVPSGYYLPDGSILPPRDDMEEMIGELRKRTIRWLRRRIAEKIFIGGARAFTGSTFGSLTDKSGFPHRINDPNLTHYLFNEFGRQAWLSGVYDGLMGQAESKDMLFKSPDEELSTARSAIESRKMNIHYAVGKKPGKATRRRKIEWVTEWLYGLAGYRPSDGRKIAELIVDGSEWDFIERQAIRDRKSAVEMEVIEEVFSTFHNVPLDVV